MNKLDLNTALTLLTRSTGEFNTWRSQHDSSWGIDFRIAGKELLRDLSVNNRFREANLCSSDFRGMDLTGFDFLGASLIQSFFNGSLLHRAIFQYARMDGSFLDEALGAGTDFSGANLYCSRARYSRFTSAKFNHANLLGADFSQSDLSGSDFSNARVSEEGDCVQLYGSNLWRTTGLPESLVKSVVNELLSSITFRQT